LGDVFDGLDPFEEVAFPLAADVREVEGLSEFGGARLAASVARERA
jgi:hypothetical protein